MSVRIRRLYADYKRVSEIFKDHPYITIKEAIGNPPEKYLIEYRMKGLEQKGDEIIEKNYHLVEVILTRNYPKEAPLCRMLTPVFHPNIAPHAICIGDHWTAGESLADLIVRIGEMICYQSYNIKSPLNGEAARWADENINRLPIDNVDLTLKRRPEQIIVQKDDIEKLKVFLESPPTKEEKMDNFCQNCGAKGENVKLFRCINAHLVCSDCIIECQICGAILCVLCSLNRCSICGKIICEKCRMVCSLCKQVVCKEHFDYKENVCKNCLEKKKSQLRITYDEIKSDKVDEIITQENIYKFLYKREK